MARLRRESRALGVEARQSSPTSFRLANDCHRAKRKPILNPTSDADKPTAGGRRLFLEGQYDFDGDPHAFDIGFFDGEANLFQASSNVDGTTVHQVWKVLVSPFVQVQHDTVFTFSRNGYNDDPPAWTEHSLALS